MAFPFIARDPGSDVIKAQSLGTTTTAGVAAAVVGVGGAVAAFLPEIAGLEKVPEGVKVAGVLVVGLALVAWGIATAGDALARAYATAHIDTDGKPRMGPAVAAAIQRLAEAHENTTFGVRGVQKDGSDDKRPALGAAIQRLAEAQENATFGVPGVQNDGSDARRPALAEAIREMAKAGSSTGSRTIIEAPRGLTHEHGGQAVQVAALVFPREGEVQKLYFDGSGMPHLTEPLRFAK